LLKEYTNKSYIANPGLLRKINRRWYEYVSKLDTGTNMLFMNYGYASLNPNTPPIPLEIADEQNRYPIQLYHHIASALNLSGLNMLEVGCGRGGGATYIMRYLKPHSIIGVDITANAINFCNRHYAIRGVSFIQGNAEALQFADNTFDVVINVESSHCYPNVESFFREATRVLKPGGYFLYTDFRKKERLKQWQAQLKHFNLALLNQESITANIVKALDLDNERKQDLINQHVPRLFHTVFNEFAGMKGSKRFYGAFANGKKEYLSFILRKKE